MCLNNVRQQTGHWFDVETVAATLDRLLFVHARARVREPPAGNGLGAPAPSVAELSTTCGAVDKPHRLQDIATSSLLHVDNEHVLRIRGYGALFAVLPKFVQAVLRSSRSGKGTPRGNGLVGNHLARRRYIG